MPAPPPAKPLTPRSPRPIPYPKAPAKPGRAAFRAEVHSGMGALPHGDGVAFRVWAPRADAVSVIGTFND